MKFRLPAKVALLIMNIIILGFFLFYFFVLGMTFVNEEHDVALEFRKIIFKKTAPVWGENDFKTIVTVAFGNLNNYFNLKWINNGIAPIPQKINFDILFMIMMVFPILNLIFSISNMFITKNVKAGIAIDVIVKLFMATFVLTTVLWIVFLTKEPLPIYCDEGFEVEKGVLIYYQKIVYFIIFSATPLIFITAHSIMNAPLYRN